jgi:CRISPR/Cas system-associated exonuclease Cas4 (RecB family)
MQKTDEFADLLKSTIENKFKELSRPIGQLQYLTVTQISQCLRRSWYQLKKGGLDLASEYADMGIAFHQLVEDAVKDKKELGTCYTEVDIVKQFYNVEVRGRIDTVCISRNVYRIIEFKTTNMSNGFRGIEENHLRQVSLYWYLTDNQPLRKPLRKELYLVYTDRRSGEVKVINLGYMNILKRTQLRNRVRYLVKTFNENKLARAEPGKACTFCPYKGVCKAWKR